MMLTFSQTAGLTSGAVQAPGSGSEILHQHQLHRNESDGHLHAHHDANRTTDSGYTDLSESEGDEAHQEMLYDDEYEDEEDRLIAQGGIGIPVDEVGPHTGHSSPQNGNPAPLLPALREPDLQRKCLVLDLDETLLHSSFKVRDWVTSADSRCCRPPIISFLSRLSHKRTTSMLLSDPASTTSWRRWARFTRL